MKVNLRLAFLPLGVVFCSHVYATTVTLNATADARIIDIFSGTNYGTDFLSTYNFPGNQQNSALHFDVSSLVGQNIISAELRLFGTSFNNQSSSVSTSLWRIGTNWTENQVTWLNASTGNPWSNAGGDNYGQTGGINTNPYSVTTYNQGENIWIGHDATSLVSEWVNGSQQNFGMMLTSTLNSSMVYVSREGQFATQSFEQNRPELVVVYDSVPEPFTLLLLGGAGIFGLSKRRRK